MSLSDSGPTTGPRIWAGSANFLSGLVNFPTLHGATPHFVDLLVIFRLDDKPHHAEILGRGICFRDITASGQILKLGDNLAEWRYVGSGALDVITGPQSHW